MLPLLRMQEAPPQSNSSSNPQKQQHQQMLRTASISILVMSLPVLYVSFLHVPPAALFRDTTFWFLISNSIIIVIAADSGMLFFGSSSSSRSSSSVDLFVDNDDGEPATVTNGGSDVATAGISYQVEVENQVMVHPSEKEDVATMVAENDHAYALVPRDDQGDHRRRRMASEPESRHVMVVTPPSFDLLAGPIMVRANRTGASMTTPSSRSPAREERLRRRHSHRPSSHSRALVPVPVQDKSVVVVTEEKQQQQLRRTATTTMEEKEKESEYSRLSDEELNRRVEEFIAKFNREMRLQLERELLALAAA